MKCSQCGSSNSKDAQFCSNCGVRLGSYCTKCGTEVSIGDDFCRKCGNSLGTNKGKPAKADATPPAVQQTAANEQKRKKTPIWLLIVLGGAAVVCVLAAIFGDISFHIGSAKETETPSISEATLTPMVIAAATETQTPTLEAKVIPVYDPIIVSLQCNPEIVQFAFEHQPVTFLDTWVATTEQYVIDFMDYADITIYVDDTDQSYRNMFGQPYSFLFDDTNVFAVDYGFDSDPFPAGMHLLTSTMRFGTNITDGVDEYGPGTPYESYNFQCPLLVGAPDDSWKVIAQSDFSREMEWIKTYQTENDSIRYDVRESDNGAARIIYEILDPESWESWVSFSHAIQNLPLVQDQIISIDMNATQISTDASYGLTIRRGEEGYNGYFLDINPSTQAVNFFVVPPGSEESITLFQDQSSAVRPGEKNQITLIANGTNFALWVNQQFVFYLEDSTVQTPGYTTINVSSIGSDQSVFEFDNLLLRAPVQ